MTFLFLLLVAAVIFAICYGVDRAFQKLFRNKAQHMSGLAVRVNKRYGLFGLALLILAVMAFLSVSSQGRIVAFGGGFCLVLGGWMVVYYLTSGIFYDGESLLVTAFGRKDRCYRFSQIVCQRLYTITGGSTVVELEMDDGKTVSVQSNQDGMYPFLDTAFIGWCREKGVQPENCPFYDPSKSWWFPHEEEV